MRTCIVISGIAQSGLSLLLERALLRKCCLARASEETHVPVRIDDFKTAQPVIEIILQRFFETGTSILEFLR